MKKYIVEATNAFLIGGGIKSSVLGRIPDVGEQFIVDGNELLPLINNNYGVKFVNIIGEFTEEPRKKKDERNTNNSN